ncbi:GNAT family N-acetyltransferase [Kribbella voronezhensis]|uniref:GNAT family N-acetyltransferase n=1 Tax=Kribbella voronezhensis TaxID=2512212 RepID=UPI00106307F2|nr:GNAT family N-acetyltransferase [Kribbella voronezhensis]
MRGDHAEAVLAFEVENREFFAARIADRGDAYFAEFTERHAALVADQEAGELHFHVLVDDEDRVIGRVNLVDVADGSAELGYRIADRATGRGLATAAVREMCILAARDYGLTDLRAGTSAANKASRAVLERNGFVQVGEPTTGDRPQVFYTRRLDG